MSQEGTVSKVELSLMFLRKERGQQAANITSPSSEWGAASSTLGAECC